MRVINNLGDQSHLNVLLEQFSLADEVYLVSPFLSEDLGRLLHAVDTSRLRAIHLISKLPPPARQQIKPINALNSFYDAFHALPQWSIKINNALHGKIYLFYKNGEPVSAIVTSANLTTKGMSQNDEWGVITNDAATISLLKEQVLSTVNNAWSLSLSDLQNLKQKADDYVRDHPNEGNEADAGPDLTEGLSQRPVGPVVPATATIWLKPIGWRDGPIPISEPWDSDVRSITFGRRPIGIKDGDIIITYAVEHRRLLGVGVSLGNLTRLTADERALQLSQGVLSR